MKYLDSYYFDLDLCENVFQKFNQIFHYTLYCDEACNELGPGNTAHFEMLQRWRAVGNTVSDLTGPRFEPQIFRFKDERVTARPTGRENVFLR